VRKALVMASKTIRTRMGIILVPYRRGEEILQAQRPDSASGRAEYTQKGGRCLGGLRFQFADSSSGGCVIPGGASKICRGRPGGRGTANVPSGTGISSQSNSTYSMVSLRFMTLPLLFTFRAPHGKRLPAPRAKRKRRLVFFVK